MKNPEIILIIVAACIVFSTLSPHSSGEVKLPTRVYKETLCDTTEESSKVALNFLNEGASKVTIERPFLGDKAKWEVSANFEISP